MPKPRRPWRTPTTTLTPPPRALAALAVLILSFTSCAPDPTPSPTVSPTVSPTGPSTPPVSPTPITTTIGSPTTGPTSSPVPTSTSTPVPQGPAWTFVVVRHANRAGGNDPPLTEAGEIRARRLGDQLSTHAGVAVYATNDRRTRATARPTAVVWEVPVSIYKAGLAPAALVAQIKQQHPRGEILIVGDSDTVPGIVGELCHCKVGPMIPENDYANRFIVVLSSDSSVLKMEHQIAY